MREGILERLRMFQEFQNPSLRVVSSGEDVPVGILRLYLSFSSSMSHFQPIFLSFVVISSVLTCRFSKGHVVCRKFTLAGPYIYILAASKYLN